MEKEEKKLIDVSIKKLLEIKLKKGSEMEKVQLDESSSFKGIYFRKGNHLYRIDLKTKKIKECELSKNKEIIYIASNRNNDSLICVLKNGNIISIDPEQNIKNFKNLNLNVLTGKNNFNLDDIKLFANNNIDKFVIITDMYISLWYRNSISNIANDEIYGNLFNINKHNEFKKKKININNENGFITCSNATANFSNHFYLGSFTRIFNVITKTRPKAKDTKITIFDYIFKFDYNSKFRSVPYDTSAYIDICNNFYNTEEIEDLNDIKVKVSSSKISLLESESAFTLSNQKILVKSNVQGGFLAICLNFNLLKNITIIIMMCESYKFTSCKLYKLIGDKLGTLAEISDMEWICNDMFLVLITSTGTFIIMNINFQIIQVCDLSNCLLSDEFYYTPKYYNNNKPKQNDPVRLLTSKQSNDVLFIYNSLYAICFQVNYKTYENRLISLQIPIENFDDFLFELKYFQLFLSSSDIEIPPEMDVSLNVFDIIHKYLIEMAGSKMHFIPNKSLFIESTEKSRLTTKEINERKNKENKKENEKNSRDILKDLQSETVNNVMRTFVKYIRIFRSINQLHETNLMIVTYLIGRSYDFFIHLINHQEIFLAVLFVELCEKYLCEVLLLKPNNNNKTNKYYIGMQKGLFNPITAENLSFESFKFVNNKMIYSRMRLILIFFFLIEFRNNFALHINVLYFALAKFVTIKMKKLNLLDDILSVAKIIIKNYKYLKSENDKIGKDEFILNSISMSYKNDIFSSFEITPHERNDINFDFFAEFYSLEEMQSFNETAENYCKNDEMSLLNEYSYLNNNGILQRWIIFFTNYLYSELFQDIKFYLDNHLKQMMGKTEEVTSPEEKTLSKLVYFNINFYFQALIAYIQKFFYIMTRKSNIDDLNPKDNPKFISHSHKIIEDYNHIYLQFISPVDIPFLIFQFYIKETNQDQKTQAYEINYNLLKLIIKHEKKYNITIEDSLDFIEFLISNGFTCDYNKNNIIDKNQRMQNYIYSAFLFYIFIIHKLNILHLLEKDEKMIFNVIESLDYKRKKECYEFIYIIINGYLRYYFAMQEKQKMKTTDWKYLQISLNFIKLIFNKFLQEESFEIRVNIPDFIEIAPSMIKGYLLESVLHYEYKNINNFFKKQLFSFSKMIDINIIKEQNLSIAEMNIFEILFSKEDIVLNAFNINNTSSNFEFIKFLKVCINNFIRLLITQKNYSLYPRENNDNVIIFTIESERDYIRNYLYTSVTSPEFFNDTKEREISQLKEEKIKYVLEYIIDKIIKVNFDNKKNILFANNDSKGILISNIKTNIIKFLHLMNIIYIKIKMFSNDPFKETLTYIKFLSLGILYERNYNFGYDTYIQIIEYINTLNLKAISTNSDIANVCEILRNIHLISLKYEKNEYITLKITNIGNKIEKENKKIKENYTLFLTNELPKISIIYDKIKFAKSQNLKYSIISFFSNMYIDNIFVIYKYIVSYIGKNFLNKKDILLIKARKKYKKLSQDFFNMAGIPEKSFIDFQFNWQLVEMESLYNGIISDEYFKESSLKQNYQDNEKLTSNNRQKMGIDYTKGEKMSSSKRNRDKSLKNENRKINQMSYNSNQFNLNRQSVDSLDIREENIKTTSNKIIDPLNKSSIPILSKIRILDHIKNSHSKLQANIDNLKIKFKLIIFNKIKKYNYNKKEKLNHSNITQLKIINIKKTNSKSNSHKNEINFEEIPLKEKDDIQLFNRIQNENMLPFNNTTNQLEIIRFNKKFPFKNDDTTNSNENNSKNRLDELMDQLNKYEIMANLLGKIFAESAFRKIEKKNNI